MIHVNVWQKPLQYCKVISLQLIKKKKKHEGAILAGSGLAAGAGGLDMLQKQLSRIYYHQVLWGVGVLGWNADSLGLLQQILLQLMGSWGHESAF